MTICETVETLEKMNGKPLKKCTLKRGGKHLKTYEEGDMNFLRKWFYEIAGYEVVKFEYNIKTNKAILHIYKPDKKRG